MSGAKPMKLKLLRWSKKIALVTAALPVFQAAGGCDLFGLNTFFAQDFTQNLAFGTLGSVVRGVQTTLVSFFPSADLLNMLLGVNNTPFFTG